MAATEVIPQAWNDFTGLTAPKSVSLASSAVVAHSVNIGCTEEALTVEPSAQWMGIAGGQASVARGDIANLILWAEPNFSTQSRHASLVVTGADSKKSVMIYVTQPPYLQTITEGLPARLETQKSSYNYSEWDTKGICSPKNGSATLCAVATNGEALTYSRDGGPIITGMKEGDYLLFAVPTKGVNAGEQIDFMCTIAAVDGDAPKYFIFEYWDNDQWNCVEESLLTAKDNPSLKYSLYCQVFANAHNTTFTQSFTLDQPINDGCVKVRLRALTKATGSVRIPNSAGYMGMYLINYPDAPQQTTDTKKILFIGNSFTYYYGTAFMFKEIARSQGHQVNAVISIKGSQEFKEHLELTLSQEAIKQGGYDYAFLQDTSPNAAYYADELGKDHDVRKAIRVKCEEINDLTLTYSPDCQIIYERTWACPEEGNTYRGYDNYERLECFLKKGMELLQAKVNENN